MSLELGKTEDCKKVAHHGFRPLIGTDSIGIDTVGHRAVSKIIERSIQSVSAQEPVKSKPSEFQVLVVMFVTSEAATYASTR